MITGPEKKSLIARGPIKRGSTIKRFDCIALQSFKPIE